jgi:cell volume regulation protein A
MEMELSEDILIAMVKRGEHYFVPKGDTKIKEGDILLTISDDEVALCETCKNMGIEH